MPRGYGSYVLHDAEAVAGRVGESRTNHEVFQDLCRRLDLEKPDDPRTEDDIKQALLGPYADSNVPESLQAARIAHPEFGEAPVQFVDVFPRTEDEKIHLLPTGLDDEAPHGLYTYQQDPATTQYPLALVSPSSNRTINSMMGQLYTEQVPVKMNPTDASERKLDDGAVVRVFNELGEVRCLLAVDPGIRAGVVEIPKGIWSHNTMSGTSSNALSPDTLTDLGEGACFNDARVEVVADRV